MKYFRIWCKNKNEWEKDLCVLLPNGEIAEVKYLTSNSMRTLNPKNHILEFSTGLKDKNGKEIYEGDIIAGIFVWGAVGGEVHFDESVAAFGIKKDMLFDAHDLKSFEVKGNIHENPELLTTDI